MWRCKLVGYVPQESYPTLHTLKLNIDQVAEALVMNDRLYRSQACCQAVEILVQVGLTYDVMATDAYPHQISGEQKQLALIEIQLACEPKLIIA